MQNTFWASVGRVFSGMAMAQAVPLLGSLVITRVYSPADFGVFSAWVGLVSLAAIVITGRFEVTLAIVEDGPTRVFAAIATLATTVISCLALAIATVITYKLALMPTVPTDLFIAFVPASFLAATVQVWQSWAAAEGKYTFLSGMRLVQALGGTGTQILLGLLAPSGVTMAFGYIVGLLIATFVSAHWMPVAVPLLPWRELLNELKRFWSRHRRFPLLSLPADSINTAAAQLPMLILASKFSPDAAGLFALSMRVLGAPIGLLGAAVRDVFKRTASASFRATGSCRKEYIRTLTILGIGSSLLGLAAVFLSEPAFVLAFGDQWRKAGLIAGWLIPLFMLRFVASPLSYTFYIAEKQHVDLLWQCALVAVTVFSFTAPKTMETSIQTYSAGYSLLYIVYLQLSYRFSGSEGAGFKSVVS